MGIQRGFVIARGTTAEFLGAASIAENANTQKIVIIADVIALAIHSNEASVKKRSKGVSVLPAPS